MKHIVDIDDLKLHYDDRGAAGAAVLFIHGLGETGDSWRFQQEFFEKKFRIITPDLRGHGKSGDGQEKITIRRFADDCLALLDFLGIGKAHFVGHSMGGLISQEVAAHQPERMLSMTLSASAGFYPPPVGTEGLEERLHNIDHLPMTDFAGKIVAGACHQETGNTIRRELAAMFAANRKESYRQATISTLRSDYRRFHGEMQVPVLILVGDSDRTTPPEYARYLYRAINGARMRILSRSAHMCKLENPAEYNQALEEFLEGVARQAVEAAAKGGRS